MCSAGHVELFLKISDIRQRDLQLSPANCVPLYLSTLFLLRFLLRGRNNCSIFWTCTGVTDLFFLPLQCYTYNVIGTAVLFELLLCCFWMLLCLVVKAMRKVAHNLWNTWTTFLWHLEYLAERQCWLKMSKAPLPFLVVCFVLWWLRMLLHNKF